MSADREFLDKLDREIDSERELLVELCARFVEAPSASPPGRTVEVAQIVETFLHKAGIETERVAQDDDAPNVVGHVGDGGRHVVFNAHMDTMQPGDESRWTVPILKLTRKDGRL
jgi:succinyl-diaminopimelate desuccinylase